MEKTTGRGKKKPASAAKDPGSMPSKKEPCTPCCDMRGLLSFLILFLLSKKPLHGDALAQEIGKRKGEKPSPGTIYPALKGLKEAGFINEQRAGKTIVYSLTPEGRGALKEAKHRFCQIFFGVIE